SGRGLPRQRVGQRIVEWFSKGCRRGEHFSPSRRNRLRALSPPRRARASPTSRVPRAAPFATTTTTMTPTRCHWPKSDLMIAYHDDEWGVPSRDDGHLFEHLVLEGAQAGLNWELVLKKRRGYRRAFADYDLEKIARFTEKRVEMLTQDPGIVRNRAKIKSVIVNARATLKVQEELGSLATLLWDLVG